MTTSRSQHGDLRYADADAHADKTYLVTASSVTMIVMSVLAVFLRFMSRRVVSVPFALDDWLILAAMVRELVKIFEEYYALNSLQPFALVLPAIDLYGTYQGYFGRHITIVPQPLEYLPILLIGLYVYDIAYNFAIALAKLSMLAIYWRIFHADSFKLPLLITAGVTLAWLISCVRCLPVIFEQSTHLSADTSCYLLLHASARLLGPDSPPARA